MVEKEDIKQRMKEFIENEARSCSMDSGCITPEYVYRMWGGSASLEEIERAMEEVRGLTMEEGRRKMEEG